MGGQVEEGRRLSFSTTSTTTILEEGQKGQEGLEEVLGQEEGQGRKRQGKKGQGKKVVQVLEVGLSSRDPKGERNGSTWAPPPRTTTTTVVAYLHVTPTHTCMIITD